MVLRKILTVDYTIYYVNNGSRHRVDFDKSLNTIYYVNNGSRHRVNSKDCINYEGGEGNGFIIYNHTNVLHMMWKFTNGRELHRASLTHITTSYLTLNHEFRFILENMVHFEKRLRISFAKYGEGGDFGYNVHFTCKLMNAC